MTKFGLNTMEALLTSCINFHVMSINVLTAHSVRPCTSKFSSVHPSCGQLTCASYSNCTATA